MAAKFLQVLHSSIRRALAEGLDEDVKAEALQHPVGWMHINGVLFPDVPLCIYVDVLWI